MINLAPITNCSKREFDKIRAAKNNPHKCNLNYLANDIHKRYDLYSENFENNTFEKILPEKFKFSASIKSCYNSTTDALDNLKISIKKNQLEISHKICQYCGINTDDQIDHYLPKEEFLDFNVHSLNMIPCCARCNQNKGQYWIDKFTNEKGIINLYRDELVRVQYLFVNIKFSGGIFIGNYYLENSNNIPQSQYRQICNHYKQLDLIERYNDLLPGLYESDQRIIDSFKSSQTDMQIKQSLTRLYESDSEVLGINNYKVVARRGIANRFPF
ncbi:hypothetical protein [Salinimicrobium sp. WS361]|uniref:hypothetical protein n=1 Tax=Salinimicrobium sp. WS361 TaxID=3425123 RepID=UPI003D6E46DF